MQTIQQLLKQKVDAIEQVRRELEALRSVTSLLSDSAPGLLLLFPYRDAGNETSTHLGEALRTVAPLLVDEADEFDPEIRARLVKAAENDFNLGRVQRISLQLKHIVAPLLGSNIQEVTGRHGELGVRKPQPQQS
ncbi:MAG TPA: hypothetical protein VLL05_14260 [Terriglobales bacterium]|nr:hypothetical protein [Terriglobales bacterium]